MLRAMEQAEGGKNIEVRNRVQHVINQTQSQSWPMVLNDPIVSNYHFPLLLSLIAFLHDPRVSSWQKSVNQKGEHLIQSSQCLSVDMSRMTRSYN